MTKSSSTSTQRSLREIIADDSHALTFQTSGQYRAALLQHDAMERAKHQEAFAWAVFAENNNVIIWSKDRSQVELASTKFGRPVVPIIALSVAEAAAPGALGTDEMTRLRRLMRALGHTDAFDQDDDYVRGIMCTLLGQAAGEVERANQPAPTVPAGDALRADANRYQMLKKHAFNRTMQGYDGPILQWTLTVPACEDDCADFDGAMDQYGSLADYVPHYPALVHQLEQAQAEPQHAQFDASKGYYWFSVLLKCARLLGLPDDESIPSGVLAAVEKLIAAQLDGGQGENA